MSAADAYPNIPTRGAIDLSVLQRPVAPPPGEPGGAPAAGGYVIDLTTENFPQVAQASTQYPIIVLLWLPTDKANADLATTLGAIATEFGGRFLLARADVATQPQIAAAFQVEGVPTVVALLAGQPLPLFAGAASEAEIKPVLDQVLAAAEQNGIVGRAPLDGEPAPLPVEPEEPPLPPLHQEAYDAIEDGNWDAAADAYERALKQDPRDSMAISGLANVHLMQRVTGYDVDVLRGSVGGLGEHVAADGAVDLDAALALADLEVFEGSFAVGLDRLLAILPDADAETKETLRVRLLEYFNLIGLTDPLVVKARQKLSLYLY